MLTAISQDLKAAIFELPQKEKEKLLLRLIKKDKTLINQLHFQLLEDETDLENRKKKTFNLVDQGLHHIKSQIEGSRYYKPRQLTIDLRSISGFVNQHLLITKDKLGELDLRIHILSNIFNYGNKFLKDDSYDNDKFLKYIAGRIKNILASYNKLHEDLQYDYQEKVNELLKFAYTSALDSYLQELRLPKDVL